MLTLQKVVLFFAVLCAHHLSFAQGVNLDKIDTSQDTTISIKKGAAPANPNEARFEITEGNEDLSGDPAPLQKDARANWKKACDEWKKEFRELNKDNQILNMNCGTPQCATTAMETVCKSTTTHKLKVRMN